MTLEYELDTSTPLVKQSSNVSASLLIPQKMPDSLMSSPRDNGSLWYLTVSGVAIAYNIGLPGVAAPAVWGVNNIIEPGNNLTLPLRLPPGATFNFVTGGGNGYVSLHRAVRT